MGRGTETFPAPLNGVQNELEIGNEELGMFRDRQFLTPDS